MRPQERLTVLCTLLLLYVLFSAPVELLTVFWHRTTSAAVGISSPSPLKRLSTGSAPGLSTNYASLYLGAAVVSMEPSSCHGGVALISESVDKYVLCPCDAPRKQFVVQLIRDVQVRSVMVRNAEHFSSGVRNFTLLGSLQYPTSTWLVLGHFEAEQRRGRQYFDVAPRSRVRFIKLQWATSYGPEPWCTITSFQVYGIDVLETLTRYDGGDDLVAGEDAAGASGGLRGTPDMHRFHLPALPPTPGEVAAPPLAGSSAVPSRNGATSANDAPAPAVFIDELAAGMWAGAAATVGASRGADADDLLLAPVDVGASAETGPLSQADADAKRSSPTNSIALAATAPALQSVNCSAAQPIGRNASVKCTITDLTALWGPCAVATSGASDFTAVTTPTSAPALSVSTPSSKGLSASGSIYQSAAGSLLTNLLRQQRSTHHELTLLMQRERHLAQELNRTRILLSDFYARYKATEREADEYRDRLHGLQSKLQLLQERFLREHSSCCGEGGGAGRSGGSIMRSDTAMAVASFALLALAVILMLMYSSSSSRSVVGPPSGWGRYYNIGRGSGGVASGGGNRPPLWPRPQRGRAR